MSAPSNTAAATAITLAEGTIAQRVDDGGVTYVVYYKYTNSTPGDQVVSIGYWGDLGGGGFRPSILVWLDEGLTVFLDQIPINGCETLPCPAGFTLYFEVRHATGNFVPSNLNIKFLIGPTAFGRPGNVFIRSASGPSADTGYTGWMGGFIDTAAQEITGFVPQFITGENGDILPTSGRMLFGDEYQSLGPGPTTFDYYLYLYDPNFRQLARILIEDSPLGAPRIRTHNPTGKFYVLNKYTDSGAHAAYYVVDQDGNRSGRTTFTRTGSEWTCAVNSDETRMYVAYFSGEIKQLDMATQTLSAFVSTVAGYRPSDILTMSDDTIVVVYLKTSAPRSSFVRHYEASGATLGTYTPSLATTITSVDARLGYSANKPEAFWLLNHLTIGRADVRLIRLSDRTELRASLTPDLIQAENPQADPLLPMTSDSCPIIELRSAWSTPRPSNPSIPCCVTLAKARKTKGSTSTTSGRTARWTSTGRVLKPVNPTAWVSDCEGGGDVPSAPDPTDSEDWS